MRPWRRSTLDLRPAFKAAQAAIIVEQTRTGVAPPSGSGGNALITVTVVSRVMSMSDTETDTETETTEPETETNTDTDTDTETETKKVAVVVARALDPLISPRCGKAHERPTMVRPRPRGCAPPAFVHLERVLLAL